ncbi:MAG: sulfite exporter TauE/SafE family protein [Armatimonadetes bacterium]|nr:sulfite exporter TauE/SafE family protein [Armatimonadota bacterium]
MGDVVLWIGTAVVATAYSMVGHGGASGYLALLAFTSIPTKLASTTALELNVVVSAITFFAFRRARHFDWNLAWPFMLGSIPFAFLGGRLQMESRTQSTILAGTLMYAAFALVVQPKQDELEPMRPKLHLATLAGVSIGLVSGIVGVGGGIFLSPLMILLNWARPHKVAAVSACFIFVNSVAGLLSRPMELIGRSIQLWPLVIVAVFGAVIGSYFGAVRTSSRTMRVALAMVLLLAVWKLVTKALML